MKPMSSRETGECALKCLVLHRKICTSRRMYHVQEAAVERSFKVKRRAGARKFTQVCIWTFLKLVGILISSPSATDRSKVWSCGPTANFHGWRICACSSSLVLISNTLLFSRFSVVQFKGLCKNREENCIINFILQNKIQGRKQCPREVACARSPSSAKGRGGLHPSCSTQKARVLLKSLSLNGVSSLQLII